MTNILQWLRNLFAPRTEQTTTRVEEEETSVEEEEETLEDKVRDFLYFHTRIYEVVRDLEEIMFSPEKLNALVLGAVQSGKSRLIHALTLYYILVVKEPVVVMLRNCSADLEQMGRGFELFLEEFYDYAEINVEEEVVFHINDIHQPRKMEEMRGHEEIFSALERRERGCVLLCLANVDNVKKANACLGVASRKVLTIVDECDQLLYSGGHHFPNHVDELLSENTHYLFGISATLFESFCPEYSQFNTKNCYVMPPPENYKGILDIKFEYINPIDKHIKKTTNSSQLSWDHELTNFLNKIMDTQPYEIGDNEYHPIQALIKTERLIEGQTKLAQSILDHDEWAKKFTIITYNGQSTSLYAKCLRGKIIRLPYNHKREKNQPDTSVHIFENVGIQSVLQYLKENGGAIRFSHILIISEKLAGRGINFVSTDFKWHCTHMFYRPYDSSRVTELLQSMRLCGIYEDNIPPVCYMEYKDYDDMYRGFQLQNDMFARIKKTANRLDLSEWLTYVKFHYAKVPTYRKLCRGKINLQKTKKPEEDDGMTFEMFMKDRCVQDATLETANNTEITPLTPKVIHRLTNDTNGLFKKWANPKDTSIIARFMRDGIHPRKKYTKKEFNALCADLKSIKHFNNVQYQHMIVKDRIKDQYYLHPDLAAAYEKYFK